MKSLGWRRYSTNTLIAAGLAMLSAILVAAAFAGAFSVSRAGTVSERLVDRLSPARIESQGLFTALLDQETAVRGYALAARPEFLTPYREAVAAEGRQAEQLRALLAGEPELLSALDHVESAAREWRTQTAEPVIAEVSAGRTPQERVLVAGKQQFDTIRARIDDLNGELSSERAEARTDLAQAMRWQNATLIVVVTLFALCAVLLALLIRRGIGRPLSEIAVTTRAVADGDFYRAISVDGPADLRRLGRDIESMRKRIVSELEVSVTQSAQLEQANADLLRSNGELEQFAYVASHDLQEPLRKVASFSQLLERRYAEVLDERGKQYIAFAVDGAERMQVLINDLLAFSRVGRVYDTASTVDLAEVLETARKNLSQRIEDTAAEITAPELPTVQGEPTLMGMLWQNLLSNALKFHDQDVPPRITITAERQADAADMWEFSVGDNGIGIDPQFSEKIFVIFQRLHSRGDNYGGTGIGLAMCRKIVEYHGGKIWLDTTHTGPGSTFRFTLPAVPDEMTSPEPNEPPSEESAE